MKGSIRLWRYVKKEVFVLVLYHVFAVNVLLKQTQKECYYFTTRLRRARHMSNLTIVGRRGHSKGKFTGLIKFQCKKEAETYIKTKTKTSIKLEIKEN